METSTQRAGRLTGSTKGNRKRAREQPVASGKGIGLVESDPALQFFYESRVADLSAVTLRDVIEHAFHFDPLRKEQQTNASAIGGSRQFLEHGVYSWRSVFL